MILLVFVHLLYFNRRYAVVFIDKLLFEEALTIKGTLLSFSELMQIEDEIDELYLPYQVDLSQYEALENTDLLDHINRMGVIIYSKEPKEQHY